MNARTTILGFSLLLGLGSTAALASDLVVNGSFSAGNTGFSTGYTLTTQTPQLFENGLHGIYAVIPIGNVAPQSAYNDWVNVTVDPSGGNGNVYVADGATTYPTTVWQETLAVAPGSGYLFSYDAAEISTERMMIFRRSNRSANSPAGIASAIMGIASTAPTNPSASNGLTRASALVRLKMSHPTATS